MNFDKFLILLRIFIAVVLEIILLKIVCNLFNTYVNDLGLDASGYHATRAWAEGRAPGSSLGTHVQA